VWGIFTDSRRLEIKSGHAAWRETQATAAFSRLMLPDMDSRHAARLSGRAARSARGRPKIGAVSSYHRSAAFLPERCACGVLQPDKHLPKRSNLTTSLPAGFSRAKELLYGVRF